MSESPETPERAHARYVGDAAPFVISETARPLPGGLIRKKGDVVELAGWAAAILVEGDEWEAVSDDEGRAAIEAQVSAVSPVDPAVPRIALEDYPAYRNPEGSTGDEIDAVLRVVDLPTTGLVAERRERLLEYLRGVNGDASTTDNTGDTSDE